MRIRTVAARSSTRTVLHRFRRHRAAMCGLGVLSLIVVLTFSSIGFGPVPGWWHRDFAVPMPLLDAGAPTLTVWPLHLGEHPFGQDNIGRDYFALTMRGAQQSLIIAFLVGIVGTAIGTAIGAVAGYFRGWAEAVLMRLTDVMITIPLVAVAAVVAVSTGGVGGVWGLGVFLGLVTWTGLARIVRGEFLSLREKEFVDAARSVGASSGRIIARHILPNTIGVIIVAATLAISSAILLESALSFLGFGVRSPDTSLGQLINSYRSAMTVRPWLFWWPGGFIITIALAVNVIGDGLRDAFDPRQDRQKSDRRSRTTIEVRSTDPPRERGDLDPILEVRGLGVDFRVEGEWVMAARDVSFTIMPGEVLAVVGESGSGKSVCALGILGLLPTSSRTAGSATLRGTQLIGARPSALRAVRGNDVGLIFQEPATALNPVLTVGFQVTEVLLNHQDISPRHARTRAIELLRLVDLPDPERRFDTYPHQLSGGQRQRVMIAMAIACDPVLLIADEPTTALDVTVQAEILDLLRTLHQRLDSAILLITHDMGVVADLADTVVVMKDGAVVEAGPIRQVFSAPRREYTRELLAAVPHLGARIAACALVVREPSPAGEPAGPAPAALDLRNLVIEYPGHRRTPPFRAVDDVSFSIAPGEVLGLVGESGSGKTTIGRAVVGLLPVTGGSVSIAGADVAGLSRRELRPLRRRSAIVFQDPAASLNPRMTIGESVGEPLFLHERLRKAALDRRVAELLDTVRLPHAYRNRYPHELSGGQRQRVGIARALALEPDLLVADEPTSALDVSVQAHVLELLQELQRERGFACLFISHDLAVVEILASRVAVLHHGRLVEIGTREQVLLHPREPYTRRLVAAAPVPDPDEQRARRAERARALGAGAGAAR